MWMKIQEPDVRLQNEWKKLLFITASHHGTNGPLSVERARHSTWLLNAFLKAAETLGYPIRDPSLENQSGFSPYLFNIHNGKRASTADAYLRPALTRDNLDVVLNTQVRKVLFDDKRRAIGIEATQDGGLTTFDVSRKPFNLIPQCLKKVSQKSHKIVSVK